MSPERHACQHPDGEQRPEGMCAACGRSALAQQARRALRATYLEIVGRWHAARMVRHHARLREINEAARDLGALCDRR